LINDGEFMLTIAMLIALLGFQPEGIDGFGVETLCCEQIAQLSETPQDAKDALLARYSDLPVATPQTPPDGLERPSIVPGPGTLPEEELPLPLARPDRVAILAMTGFTLLLLLYGWMRRKQ
jgi:hypothetical protein